jgi:nucleoid-associated protein YgaU
VRVLLGGSLLVLLFLAASLWQRTWTSAARAERSAERGDQGAPTIDVPPGWSRVVIGRPSGAEPFRGSSSPSPQADASGGGPTPTAPQSKPSQPKPTLPDAPERPSQVIVRSGQNLTAICREHYGTARVDVVAAVSRHNQLANPDALREGQTLELPPLDQLIGKR